MSLAVERQPIDLSTLPENLHKHLDPAAPPPLKMMAARGMLPVPPEQNIQMLYSIAIGTDRDVANEALTTLGEMPNEILVTATAAQTHEGVLDWLADRLRQNPHVLSEVVTNRSSHSNTIARIAAIAGPNLCDVIATNQVRILEAPAIIEQMYQNPHARMATVDRLVELAQREQVELKGLPGLQHAINSGQKIFGKAEGKEEFFQREARKGDEEAAKLEQIETMSRSEREKFLQEQEQAGADESEERKSTMLSHQIGGMSISEKIRLATIGGREAINLLVRDPNKLVHMAAVRSPRVKFPDVKMWSRNKTLPDGVISYIASQRDYTRHYEVMVGLCQNPKTPLSDTMKFLNHLRTNDLKHLASDRTVPMQVSRQAKNLYRKRSGGSR